MAMEDTRGPVSSRSNSFLNSIENESHEVYNSRKNDEITTDEQNADLEASAIVQDDVYKILGDSEDHSERRSRGHVYHETLLQTYRIWVGNSVDFMTEVWKTTSNFCKATWDRLAITLNELSPVEAAAFAVAVTIFIASLLFLVITI